MTVRIIPGAIPGHRLTAAPENVHFFGRCAECDAWVLALKNLDAVEDYYHTGRIGQDQFEAYMYLWVTGSVRYGHYGSWVQEPTAPDVLEHVRLIREARAARDAKTS